MPKVLIASLLALASSHRIHQANHDDAISQTVDTANMTEPVQFAWAEPADRKRHRKVYRIVSLSSHPDIGGKCVTTYDGSTRGMYYDTCTVDNDLQEWYFEEGKIKSYRTDQCLRRTMKGALGTAGWTAEVATCREMNKCYWYVTSDGAILDAGNVLKKPKMKEMSYDDLPVNKVFTHCLTAGTLTSGLAVASCGVPGDWRPTPNQKWKFVQAGGPEDPFDGDISFRPHWEKVMEIAANPYTFTSSAQWASNNEITTTKSFTKTVSSTLTAKYAVGPSVSQATKVGATTTTSSVSMGPELSASIAASITASTNTVEKTGVSESRAQSQTKVYKDKEGYIIWPWTLGIDLPKTTVSFKTEHQKVLPKGEYPKCQPMRFKDDNECFHPEEEIPCEVCK